MRTPQTEDEFSEEWVAFAVGGHFDQDEEEEVEDSEVKRPKRIVKNVRAKKNEIQGILSSTFVVDFDYPREDGEAEEEEDFEVKKSIFVKVPLQGEPLYKNVNEREIVMFKEVLPKLQRFLDDEFDGFFKIPMPVLIKAEYSENPETDVFVFENLLNSGFYNYTNQALDEDHMKSVLDGLAYFHGAGLAYKAKSPNGLNDLVQEFPGLEVQIQLHDLIEKPAMREHFRKHFKAFLRFLEDSEPDLGKHTSYMAKMHKDILKVIGTLENCGYEKLVSFAHGDAKPNNFMFRKIEIDIEDLECEGIESILIDWQGGFLGSVANDIMWALYPFVEKDPSLYVKALNYYYDQLRNVIESFGMSPVQDAGLPETFSEFTSLLKKCLVLEFLIVTVIKPIMSLEHPEKLLTWHKETVKNTRRRFKKKVVKPTFDEVFSSPRFTGFCYLYFKIATALGAFQELGKIYFEVMKDRVFDVAKLDNSDSDDEDDSDLWSRVINAPAEKIKRTLRNFTLGCVFVAVVAVAWQNRVDLINVFTKRAEAFGINI